MKKFFRIATVCALLLSSMAAMPRLAVAAPPDPVLEWINIMNNTVLAGGTSPFFTSRIAAMVSASVFDAVNGIDPRFRPTACAAECSGQCFATRCCDSSRVCDPC